MRICMMLSTALPPREGIGFYVWNLAHHLRDGGHTIHLVTRRERGQAAQETVDGITIWRPPFWPVYPFHVHVHGQYVQRLVAHLEDEIDVFHLHTPLVYPIKTRKPLLVTNHSTLRSDIASIPANNRLAWLTKLQGPVSYVLEQQLFERADGLTAVASTVAQEMAAYGVEPRDVRVLGNAVDADVFSPSDTEPDREQPYVLTTGRLGLRKGLEDLIACAALVKQEAPSLRFLLAGTGPLEAALRADIARRGLQEQVILLGHVGDRRKLADLYRGATAYVHAAHYEGLSTALLEAMGCGRPVIATAVSGALDVVTPEQNGVLVPPREPARLAQAILRLLRDPDRAAVWGRAARRTVEERYTWPVVCAGYVAEYERLVRAA
jgi:glycosyltransferase involved in cell wall biosynthesis